MTETNPQQPEFQPPYQVPPNSPETFRLTQSSQYQPPPPPPPKKTSPWLKVGIIGAIFLALVLLFGACVAAMSAPDARKSAGTPNTSSPTPTCYQYSEPYCDEPTEEPAPTKTAKPKPPLTNAQEQAIGTAKDYLDYGHFSKKGLIHQLKYEGFSKRNATFAVNHIKVNWYKQAVGTAKEYLDYSHFSRSGLIQQLEYEGYTHSQATYGAKKVGL